MGRDKTIAGEKKFEERGVTASSKKRAKDGQGMGKPSGCLINIRVVCVETINKRCLSRNFIEEIIASHNDVTPVDNNLK